MNDQQAANEILAANPSMLWRTAVHASGKRFAVRFDGNGWEALLIVKSCYAVSTWTDEHFSARFTLNGYLDAKLSSELDMALFQEQINGSLQVVAA